jgi:hypothetical protein
VCAVGEVLVYEGTWFGVARCWNRSEAGHVPAQLLDEVIWVYLAGVSSAGDPQRFSVHEFGY